MMYFRRITLLISLVVFSASYCNSQAVRDTSFVTTASANAVQKYRDFIQGQSGLYSGTEYRTPKRTNEEHPFYRDIDWQEGNVFYNGEYYDDITLLYDITSDNIIIEHFYNGQEVSLIKAKVERFKIGPDRFVHLNGASLLPGLPDAGFYHVVYDGPSRVLARHVKAIEEKIDNSTVEIHFPEKSRFFVLKDGVYHKVSRRTEFLKLFPDKKSDLKSFASSQQIKVTKANPLPLARLAQYYDSLNSQNK
jgi:hypothetical protein